MRVLRLTLLDALPSRFLTLLLLLRCTSRPVWLALNMCPVQLIGPPPTSHRVVSAPKRGLPATTCPPLTRDDRVIACAEELPQQLHKWPGSVAGDLTWTTIGCCIVLLAVLRTASCELNRVDFSEATTTLIYSNGSSQAGLYHKGAHGNVFLVDGMGA